MKPGTWHLLFMESAGRLCYKTLLKAPWEGFLRQGHAQQGKESQRSEQQDLAQRLCSHSTPPVCSVPLQKKQIPLTSLSKWTGNLGNLYVSAIFNFCVRVTGFLKNTYFGMLECLVLWSKGHTLKVWKGLRFWPNALRTWKTPWEVNTLPVSSGYAGWAIMQLPKGYPPCQVLRSLDFITD